MENTSQRNKKSGTPQRNKKKQTACPHIAAANLGCVNSLYELYHLYMMKQRLTKHENKFQTLPHNAPDEKKRTYPTEEDDPQISSKIRRQMSIISHIFPHPNK